MPNWTIITADDLTSAGYKLIVDRAQTTDTGSVDPVAEEISKAVSEVRRSVAVANAVDSDPAKIPNSLKGLTVRMAIYALMRRLRLSLEDDDKDKERSDEKKLQRIEDKKGAAVEEPDAPSGSGEMQQANGVQAINVPRRQTGRDKCSGL